MSSVDNQRDWLASRFQFPLQDLRPIWAWAHDNIAELPAAYAIRGRFDVENSPWLRAPFESMSDPKVRRTTVSKAVQSGGTLLAEISLAWRVVNDPGPMAFTSQSEDMITIEGKTRLWPLFESIPAIARLMPKPGPMRTQTEVIFPGGGYLMLNSANIGDQQSQSIKARVNDEIWMPRWADVYDDACKRVTAFEQQGTSHILDVSQGGFEGDCADTSFSNGSMEEWSALCESCGKVVPLHIRQNVVEDGGWTAGLVWAPDAKRDDGSYDEVRAGETAKFRCVHCGHMHSDTDTTRSKWRRTGQYVVTRPNAPRSWKSYHWEAIVAHSLGALAVEWCQAENHFHRMGDDGPRQKFRQKREARSWKVDKQSVTIASRGDYTVKQYWNGEKVPNEAHRFMTIDRQMRGFWVEVGAWTGDPSYMQLYFGSADTLDQVRQIQKRYGVPDSCVAQDRRYLPSQVDADCIRFGWRGMMGHPRKTWTMRNELTNEIETYPHSDPKMSVTADGTAVFYEFSSSHMKDIVSNAVNGKSFAWLVPSDVNPLYPEHLKAEEKREVRAGVWNWVEVVQDRNHGFDTSAMMAAVATVVGLVKFNSKADTPA